MVSNVIIALEIESRMQYLPSNGCEGLRSNRVISFTDIYSVTGNSASDLAINVRAKHFEDSKEVNLGLLYRVHQSDESVLGIYGYYDAMRQHGHLFNQLTMGSDLFYKEFVGMRINAYVPVGVTTISSGQPRVVLAQDTVRIDQPMLALRAGGEVEFESKMYSRQLDFSMIAGAHYLPETDGLKQAFGSRLRAVILNGNRYSAMVH